MWLCAVSFKILGFLMMKCVNSGKVRWGRRVIAEERKWPTLIYPGCSLVWLVPSEHLAPFPFHYLSFPPFPSHYLPAITAVQRVSYRVINTSPRPHTASTSSSRRRLMTAKDRQCILSLVTAMLLSVHTHFTVAEERIPTPWEASSSVSPRLCI